MWALRSAAVKAIECNEIAAELFKSLKEVAIKVLHSLCQQVWKTQQWPQDWKRSFIPIPKKGSTKECANHWTIALISHASKVMLKILHARLQHYVNQELPDVQAGFRKRRGTRGQIANIHWIVEKARKFWKSISVSLTMLKPLTMWIMTNCGKLRMMGIPDHLPCLLRNLYAGQEATVRTLYGTTDWFKIEKGVWQGCLLSPCLFNLYTEHIMRNAGLDELQARVKIDGRNINSLRYVDDNHPNGRKWRGTKEPLDEGEGG